MIALTAPTPADSSAPKPRTTAVAAARFAIATTLLSLTFLVSSAGGLDATEIAWVTVLAAGLLGIGLPTAMSAGLGAIAWVLFAGFVENPLGAGSAGDDLRLLAVFVLGTVAVAVFSLRIHHVIKENAHG